jgi:phosphatidylserine decarboxylase
MRLTIYGRREWLTILAVAAVLVIVGVWLRWWWLGGAAVVVALALLSFFRDPNRKTPIQKGVLISPADGKISSIHHLDHYEPLGGPATCVRVFLSVLNVHVNRAPCHGLVQSITPRPGKYLNALNPASAEVNESNLIVLVHPVKKTPIAAVRQVSGLIARTIVCGIRVGDTTQRGQRIGMIKFGSTTELYIPDAARPEVAVRQGQNVKGGETILAQVNPVMYQENSAVTSEESRPPSDTGRGKTASSAGVT